MEEDENDNDKVWNASAVILDIDSGTPRVAVGETFLSAEMILNGRSQFFNFIINLVTLASRDEWETVAQKFEKQLKGNCLLGKFN